MGDHSEWQNMQSKEKTNKMWKVYCEMNHGLNSESLKD